MRQTIPKVPHPDTLNNLPKDEAEKLFSQWEEDCYRVQEENQVQFEKDLKKIRLCAFLRGFSRVLTPPYAIRNVDSLKEHYSWCPHDTWTDDSGKYLRIEVAEKDS